MNPIQFGTDGWRTPLDNFTDENIAKVIQAFCDAYKEEKALVIVGYDRRLKSKEAAEKVSEILASNDFLVLLSEKFCPTPCVSWMCKNTEAIAGIMITASHNPWDWNGIKFKENYGGSASVAYTDKIEKVDSTSMLV